ncbi:MAG: hypothetical protein ABR585_14165 [Gemmatimonadaceae bacterium]
MLNLPAVWEDVFLQYFGTDPVEYKSIADWLVFVTKKYMEHEAFPSKFDGLAWMDDGRPIDAAAYDDPDFYWEKWDTWENRQKEWRRGSGTISIPPTWADVAEGVMYQAMRSGLLQAALQQMGAKTRVVSPEKFLKEVGEESE